MNETAIAKWKCINIFNFLKILCKMISKFFLQIMPELLCLSMHCLQCSFLFLI